MPQSTAWGTIMLGWWRRRKELQARIDADVAELIAEHGNSAYWVARDRALELRLHKVIDAKRTPEHWDRVRFQIRKRSARLRADTATKLIKGP
ncbi:hypothetical protein [uncultured Rhodoblastus sp.]|uniref:hypothetical protein n=1 Tax=uncultured Rhodoblastus sp. TaxID=543037 RepID=UPI0025F338B9|nr:hypothetical protein [uncultured Rhodoblastus sp.]